MPQRFPRLRPYYTLVNRPKDTTEAWSIQFGAYDRSDVSEEMKEQKESEKRDGLKSEWKIVKSVNAYPSAVNAAIAAL